VVSAEKFDNNNFIIYYVMLAEREYYLYFHIIPKCAPDKKLLSIISDTGFCGVELYTNKTIIADSERIINNMIK